MNEMQLAPGPTFSPGHCFICGTNDGEMIDTRVDIRGDGRFYICLRTCLPIIGNLAGYLSPAQAAELTERVRESAQTQANLEAELAAERENKFMTVSDALKLAAKAKPAKAAA